MRRPKGNYRQHKNGDLFDLIPIGGGVTFTKERQSNSTHMLFCASCGDRAYTDRHFMEHIVLAQAFIETLPANSIEILGPACEPCHAVMEIQVLAQVLAPEQKKEQEA